MSTDLQNQNEIIDIDLSVTRKKRIRVDGDDNRILELAVTDFGILSRLRDMYPKLDELCARAQNIGASESTDSTIEDDIKNTATKLEEVDSEMRKLIDVIFDTNVSEICAPTGTMFDPFNGMFRFEIIIDTLMNLYETNISKQYKLMEKRVQKHTSKYIGK